MAAEAAGHAPSARHALPRQLRHGTGRTLAYVGLALGSLAVWQALHLLAGPLLIPGPLAVAERGVELLQSGALQEHAGISAQRLAIGWSIGCAIAIPLGLLMAQIPLVRRVVDPYLHFLRFIPPIAYVSLALIWFGIGELSKVVLIVYTTSFTVTIATLAGALSIHKETLWAARCLGANRRQTLLQVMLPATVPSIIIGMRLGLATSFKTIVGAEMIGAKTGLGYMIWSARAALDFESIFLGIVVLALMGLLADYLFRLLLRPIAYRFGLVL